MSVPDLGPDDDSGLIASQRPGDNSPAQTVSELSGALKRTVEGAFDMGAAAIGATIYFGSEESNRQIQEIAEKKKADLGARDLEHASRIIEGTARSMGLDVLDVQG